jgi:hypothetical protein
MPASRKYAKNSGRPAYRSLVGMDYGGTEYREQIHVCLMYVYVFLTTSLYDNLRGSIILMAALLKTWVSFQSADSRGTKQCLRKCVGGGDD